MDFLDNALHLLLHSDAVEVGLGCEGEGRIAEDRPAPLHYHRGRPAHRLAVTLVGKEKAELSLGGLTQVLG